MLIYLIMMLMGPSYASDSEILNGRYFDKDYGLEITVQNNEATKAKLYKVEVPLSKTNGANNIYEGAISDGDITMRFLVQFITKKKIKTDVTVERLFLRSQGQQTYNFKDIKTKLLTENDNIKSYILETDECSSELDLNSDGSIDLYNVTSNAPYTLSVKDSSILDFWCKDCIYKFMGINDNALLIMDKAYIQFSPRTINYYIVDGGTKTINTFDGTRLEIETTFYNKDKGGSLLSSKISFNLMPDKLLMSTASTFSLRLKKRL